MGSPLEFALQITVEDSRPAEATGGKRFVASILLRVRFPRRYPNSEAPPEFRVEDALVVDADLQLGPENVFPDPLGLFFLDKEKLVAAMTQQAVEMLPSPCVY